MNPFTSHTAFIGACFALFLGCFQVQATAQIDFTESRDAQTIMDGYGSFEKAVLDMTREEWTVVRAWEGFDNERYLTFLHEYHHRFDAERSARKASRVQRVQQNDACGCWVEPDDSYITMVPPPGIGGLGPNEQAWANSGGAGWNVDCASDPIPVSPNATPWTFDLYGDEYENFYVNSKGQISFGGDVIDWTPTGFPAAEYNQIAGFWQDTDIRSVGEIKWKRTQDAVYVNYIDVGYYNNQDDLTNSFQIIITYPESGILPEGNNAQVCYLDMNWSHGDVGGGGGCCGPDPGVTGADGESTNPNPSVSPHVQFGRFNLPDDTYNGPYGIGEGNDDGINWLDFKFFNINTAEISNNLNPVPTANLGCDTIVLCLGQEYSLDVEFLGPEPTQTVDLDVTELSGANVIENFLVTNGETATFTGTFVANEAGIETVSMIAEDSDGAETVLEIVIQVLDVTPPVVNVGSETGDFGICAGAELPVVAAANGGDEPIVDWSWNLNSDFWEANEATIPFGGTFVVTGETASGCVVKESFEVFQTPYYLPTVEGILQTVCPGQEATVTVVPEDDENFVDYIWAGDWNGGGGEVLSSEGPSATLTAGVFQVTVVDEGGCEGRRTFVISPSASTIPEVTTEAVCGEGPYDPVEFSGGFSSPAEGFLQLQLFSSLSGWQGSFLSVDVIHADSTITNSTVTLPSGGFANVQDLADLGLVFGDSVLITYVSADPANDEFFSFNLSNCANNCSLNPEACQEINDLATGVVYYAPAFCEVQPALGSWTEDGAPSDAFSNPDEYNTLWQPEGFGVFELCFTDDECGTETCYDQEVNLPPTIELSGDSIAFACDGDGYNIEAFIFDPAQAATINWPYPGNDNVLFNEYTWTQYTETTLVVDVENGCGEATDQVEITAAFAPVLENDYLCGEGATLELDPIAGDQNTDLVYEWTYNGSPVDDVDDNEWEVDETGSYCVTVTNGCFPDGDSDCAFIDIVSALDVELFSGGSITDCDGGGIEPGEPADLGVNPAFLAGYADYTVTWPDGTVTTVDDDFTWVVPEETDINGTQICVLVEDPYGCEPQEECGLVFIGDVPTYNPQPIYEGSRTLCPGQPEVFDLNAEINGPDYSDYSWTVQCADTTVSFAAENVLLLTGEQFPPSCWGYDLTMTASVANPCLPGGLAHEYDIQIQQCEILPPNVFTPKDGNEYNDGFIIRGLEPWEEDPEGVLVRVFDRWGNKVYEDENYRNASPWYGFESADGVYFYTILLPNGEEFTGTVNIFRSR